MNALGKLRTFLVSILFLLTIIDNSYAAEYFNNNEMIALAVSGALKESMIAGYHGSMAKAVYYIGSGTNEPGTKNMNDFFAWINAVNAYRVIESSLEVTTQPKEIKYLKSELNMVKKMIETIGKNSFNWNNAQITDNLNSSKVILDNKISELEDKNI